MFISQLKKFISFVFLFYCLTISTFVEAQPWENLFIDFKDGLTFRFDLNACSASIAYSSFYQETSGWEIKEIYDIKNSGDITLNYLNQRVKMI
jgi:hypothetical protein